MKFRFEKSVTVITPSLGSPKLIDAIESIEKQTYKTVNHLIVSDGPEYGDKVMQRAYGRKKTIITESPFNTGGSGFYGHRIYAAYPHLVNSDYILFLDEDNWYEPNHIESLVSILEEHPTVLFSYSRRKIFDVDKTYLLDDNCESLGQEEIWGTEKNPQYLIDTSSFCFRRSFLVQVCQQWHSGWGGDRRFYNAIKDFAPHLGSNLHTLCYRLDGNANSVGLEFFEKGNAYKAERAK